MYEGYINVFRAVKTRTFIDDQCRYDTLSDLI